MTWAGVLDALEAEIAGLEAAGSEGTFDFSPPAGLGPVPDGLSGRAVHLLRRMTALEEALVRRRAEIGRELLALGLAMAGPAATAAPVPHFLDTVA